MIVATSQAVADVYTDAIQADKLQVNHAGIDLTDFNNIDSDLVRKSIQTELGLANEKVVVSASMIRYWKGLHVLVRAAAEVLKHFPNVIFLIVGEIQFGKDYEYKEQLVDLVHELGLVDKFKFLGFRRDVYHIIASADCLVHCPIKSDPLPTVVLEAMALQTPIVGTAIGGIPEEVDNGLTGLLVEPGNDIELAKAILKILENPDLAKSLTQAAQRKLETEFSHQLFVKRFESIYAQVLSGFNLLVEQHSL
jgi:glycosyltransferase involved in cell wall biosynthesis